MSDRGRQPIDLNEVQSMLELASRQLCNPDDRIVVELVDLAEKSLFIIRSTRPGAVIGKQGRTVKALREVVASMGQRAGHEIGIEVANQPLS